MSVIQAANFDRELSLRDLLKGIDLKRLGEAIRTLLGDDARLVDKSGEVILGTNTDAADSRCKRVPLRVELEPIGYIEANDSEAKLQATATLVEQQLRSATRYHMASNLHLEAVHADYEKLQEKHHALQESEARYKALAENLEERVKEQVETIETAQRKLYQAEKMASVGQLAAGVAHEINNPVGFITSNLSTAQAYVEKLVAFGKQLQHHPDMGSVLKVWNGDKLDGILKDFVDLLQESLGGASRIARIVADLKGFSNVDRAENELADINQIIRSVCNVATGQVKQRAQVILELGEPALIRCRAGQLGQVFLNILLNAAQAMDPGPGEIRISTGLDRDEIIVNISDTGSGIPESKLGRIFDPFFTTREVGQGTGLGLTVALDIVQAHGGRIAVTSDVGVGTTFSIHLPVRD